MNKNTSISKNAGQPLNPPLYTPAQTKALELYLRQLKPAEIAQKVEVHQRTVQKWIRQFNWPKMREDSPVEQMLRERIAYLMWIDCKHESQLKELEMLLEQKRKRDEADARRSGYQNGNKRGRKPNKVKNDISGISEEMLTKFREKTFFEYQKAIHGHKCDSELSEFRFYLKSRQIGLTYYFAYEAFEDAVLNGDNQIFLSASRKQSEIFKNLYPPLCAGDWRC